MKKGKICFMVVLALLLTLTSVAQAELYLEGFLGGTAGTNMGGASFHQSEAPPPPPNTPGSFLNMNSSGGVTPAFVIGGRVGYWFVRTGALKLQYPDWMKYFGVYTDISFQQLRVSPESATVSDRDDQRVFQGTFPGEFYSNGYAVTWAFMLAARYGFLPNDKVPFGRLQPWVGVGPAVMWTGMRPKATVFNPDGSLGAIANPGWSHTALPALVLDAGVRYMFRPNISFDLSFRYRYAHPNFNFEFTDMNGAPSRLHFSPTYNLFSGLLGVAYHF